MPNLGCAGDAGAHNSTLNDAANPTVALTHWCRDRERGDQIPIKIMVNKQTKATAHHFGFTDRGTLEVGMKVTPDRLQTARLPGLTTMLVGVCSGGSECYRFRRPAQPGAVLQRRPADRSLALEPERVRL